MLLGYNKDTSCPICQKDFEIGIYNVDSYSNIKSVFEVRQCPTCTLMKTFPVLSRREIRRHYNVFGPHSSGDVSRSAILRLNAVRNSKLLGCLFATLYRYLKVPDVVCFQEPGRILDVGCGSGRFLVRAQALGWTPVGQEVFENAGGVARKHNIPVYIGEVKDFCNRERESFDLITMWHVLEHLEQPCATLTDLHDILRPGGRIVVEVPNANALERKIFGRGWDLWMVPYHQYHFTASSLEKALYAAGFIDVQLSVFGNHIRQSLPHCIPKLFRRSLAFIGGTVQRLFHSGSIIRATAHRRQSYEMPAT